jgi:hypothetical protein
MQSALLKMVRQEHDAVRVVSLDSQGIDTTQDFILFPIDHGDRPVAETIQIQQAILNE